VSDGETEDKELTSEEKWKYSQLFGKMRFSRSQMDDIVKLLESRNGELVGEMQVMITTAVTTISLDMRGELERIYDKIDVHEKVNVKDREGDLNRLTSIETTVKNAMWAMPILVAAVFSMIQIASALIYPPDNSEIKVLKEKVYSLEKDYSLGNKSFKKNTSSARVN